MKEHPILFSTEMVKAILEGRKTMTRRVVKNAQPLADTVFHSKHISQDGTDWKFMSNPVPNVFNALGGWFKCPYGQVGDVLWVRETWCDDCPSASEPNGVCYKANRENQPASDFCTKWKPSIFMPRWASRITLEITDIRVERLQEITEKDAIAEGIPAFAPNGIIRNYKIPQMQYEVLWDKINSKKYPWESNPWVWVISFKRVQ